MGDDLENQRPLICGSAAAYLIQVTELGKNAVNSGHIVPWQRTQAARTNSSVTAHASRSDQCFLLTCYTNYIKSKLLQNKAIYIGSPAKPWTYETLGIFLLLEELKSCFPRHIHTLLGSNLTSTWFHKSSWDESCSLQRWHWFSFKLYSSSTSISMSAGSRSLWTNLHPMSLKGQGSQG